MIEKLRTAKRRIRKYLFMVVIGIATFEHPTFNLISQMNRYFGIGEFVFIAVWILLLAALRPLLEELLDASFENSRLLRMIIMNYDNIEDTWAEVVREDGLIIRSTLLDISYRLEKYITCGVNYSCVKSKHWTTQDSFNGIGYEYNDRVLKYEYAATENETQTSHDGHGYYRFYGRRCSEFRGEFYEDHVQSTYTTHGIRLSELLHAMPKSERKNIHSYVWLYYYGGWFRILLRAILPAPDLSPSEQKTIRMATMNYFHELAKEEWMPSALTPSPERSLRNVV
jgi:hypothetical protein